MQTPITEVTDALEIEYDSDLDIVSLAQPVSIQGVTSSVYQADATNAITLNDDFTVTYLNPCIDPDYVDITVVE